MITPKREETNDGHTFLKLYDDNVILAEQENTDYTQFEIRLVYDGLEYVSNENEIFVTWHSLLLKFGS